MGRKYKSKDDLRTKEESVSTINLSYKWTEMAEREIKIQNYLNNKINEESDKRTQILFYFIIIENELEVFG